MESLIKAMWRMVCLFSNLLMVRQPDCFGAGPSIYGHYLCSSIFIYLFIYLFFYIYIHCGNKSHHN